MNSIEVAQKLAAAERWTYVDATGHSLISRRWRLARQRHPAGSGRNLGWPMQCNEHHAKSILSCLGGMRIRSLARVRPFAAVCEPRIDAIGSRVRRTAVRNGKGA